MSTELQILLGACVAIMTIVQVLVRAGIWTGGSDIRIAVLEKEVERLRSWRHSIANFETSITSLRELTADVHELIAELKKHKGGR